MRARGCFAILFVLASCGDDAPPPYGITDGTRLAARFWSAGDGARVFRTWFDRDLDVECRFDLATDGRFRCLPTTSNRAFIGYADTACTVPLLVAPECGAPPRFARGLSQTTPACGRSGATPIHDVVGARISTAFYSKVPTGCILDGAPEDFAVYDLSPPRAPTDFVAADLEVTEPAARLSPYVLVAEDGSRLTDGIWDTARDAECGGFYGGAAVARCHPAEIALHYDFLYSDDTCTVHAALDLSDYRACHPPTAIWTGDGFLELGTEVPSANVHRTNLTGMCVAETAIEPDDTYWLEGPTIAEDSFAPLSEVREGTGRIRSSRLADSDARSLDIARTFFDTSLDERCEPRKFADGYGCQSYTGVGWWGTYSDTNCRVPVIVAYDTPPRIAYSGHEQLDSCDDVEFDTAYAVGGPVDQESYYIKTETDCITRLRASNELLFARGAEIDVPRITR